MMKKILGQEIRETDKLAERAGSWQKYAGCVKSEQHS